MKHKKEWLRRGTFLCGILTLVSFGVSSPGCGGSKKPSTEAPERVPQSVNTLEWRGEGPAPSTRGQVENLPNAEVTGAIEALVIDPSNSDLVYIGAVNGGIWKSANATSLSPSWSALTDNAEFAFSECAGIGSSG